jgi:alkanesulfonate monooxygenase
MSNTLDQLTRGRVLINVVTGGFPAELAADGDFTDHDERYVRSREFMQVVRKAWTEPKRWSHEGKHYRVENADVHPKPYQKPYPPFYFGGASDAAKDVGAAEADVYLLWGETLPMVRERTTDMRARAAAIGRTLRFGMRIHVVVRETEDEARAAAEALVSEIPEGFQKMMDRHMSNSDSEGEKRQRELREQEWLGPNLWAGIGKARLGVGTALVGSGENVAARLREYVDEGIDTFILSGYPHLEEAVRSLRDAALRRRSERACCARRAGRGRRLRCAPSPSPAAPARPRSRRRLPSACLKPCDAPAPRPT